MCAKSYPQNHKLASKYLIFNPEEDILHISEAIESIRNGLPGHGSSMLRADYYYTTGFPKRIKHD